jgi:hypothetical protein
MLPEKAWSCTEALWDSNMRFRFTLFIPAFSFSSFLTRFHVLCLLFENSANAWIFFSMQRENPRDKRGGAPGGRTALDIYADSGNDCV